MATVDITIGTPTIRMANVNGGTFPWFVYEAGIPFNASDTYENSNGFTVSFSELKMCCSGNNAKQNVQNFTSTSTEYKFTETYDGDRYKYDVRITDGSSTLYVYSTSFRKVEKPDNDLPEATLAYGIALHFTNNRYVVLRTNSVTLTGNRTDITPPTPTTKGNILANTYPDQYIYGGITTTPKNAEFENKLLQGTKLYNSDDPYQNVGDDPDDPGQGDFDYTSDDIPVPDLPQTNVTDSGLVSLFAPDEGQLKQLAKFLWSDSFSLDSFKKIFNNPMDCILGLSILPIHLPHGGAKEITVGNIVSTVSCDVCSDQYVKLKCGSFTFSRSRFTGGYLDNAPYTRCYLYLPFIGTQEINIDEFMGATLAVEYHIDILTGAMFCFVTRNGNVLMTFSGNCAENVPLSANDFTSTLSSMLSMATIGAGAIATIATAGAAAPTTAGMASEALGARTASSLVGAGAQGASAVMNSKPNVQHSGSLGGGAGAMGELYPYLIFIAPRPDIPTDQNMYTGFPSNDIVQIGRLKDFNVIEAVNLKVEGANDTEMSEIEAILKGGVII